MKNFKLTVKESLKQKYPLIDFFWYDEIYDEVLQQLHARYKKDGKLCYNKRCKNRMV